MTEKKIALIGGAGFIGHNLAIALAKRGHVPHIIDSLAVNNMLAFTDGDIENRQLYWSILNQRVELLHKQGIKINVEDARNYNALCLLLGKIKPEVVVQLAAVSHADQSNKDPHSTFDHSLRTLENALDYSKSDDKVEHFIYLSSSMVYGQFSNKDVEESTHCEPIGIYGTLKYSGELLVKAYHQVFGLPYTIVRPSALYGQRCVSRRVGQIFIEKAVRGGDIVIHGDGSDRLDFTYIEDFVQGIIKVIEHPSSRNETFNITYGESRSIGDLAEILQRNFGNVNIKYEPKDRLTPDRGTLRIEKAMDLLGYKPRFSIDEGYPKYIQWYKNMWQSLDKSGDLSD